MRFRKQRLLTFACTMTCVTSSIYIATGHETGPADWPIEFASLAMSDAAFVGEIVEVGECPTIGFWGDTQIEQSVTYRVIRDIRGTEENQRIQVGVQVVPDVRSAGVDRPCLDPARFAEGKENLVFLRSRGTHRTIPWQAAVFEDLSSVVYLCSISDCVDRQNEGTPGHQLGHGEARLDAAKESVKLFLQGNDSILLDRRVLTAVLPWEIGRINLHRSPTGAWTAIELVESLEGLVRTLVVRNDECLDPKVLAMPEPPYRRLMRAAASPTWTGAREIAFITGSRDFPDGHVVFFQMDEPEGRAIELPHDVLNLRMTSDGLMAETSGGPYLIRSQGGQFVSIPVQSEPDHVHCEEGP